MKKQLGVLLVAAAVAVSVVGAVSAQREQPGRPGNEGREPILSQLLQLVAGELGIEPAAVIEQLQDQTLAEVVTANGGSVEEISAALTEALTERVNSALADGRVTQERADQILADLTANVESAMNGELRELRGLRPGMERPEQRGSRGGRLNRALNDTLPLLNAAEEATGLSARELVQAVRNGQTLGEVITANGGEPSAVVSAALATVQTTLDAAVSEGRITQEQADAMSAGVQAFYEAVMDGAWQRQSTTETVDAAV